LFYITVRRAFLCGWWLYRQSIESGIVCLVGSIPICTAVAGHWFIPVFVFNPIFRKHLDTSFIQGPYFICQLSFVPPHRFSAALVVGRMSGLF